MLLDLVQPFFRAEVILELAEISYTLRVSITLHSARFGFFTDHRLYSLHRFEFYTSHSHMLRQSFLTVYLLLQAFMTEFFTRPSTLVFLQTGIFKLFTPLASFSYTT